MSKKQLEEHTHVAIKIEEYEELKKQSERVQELDELLTQIKYDKEAHEVLREKYTKIQLQNKRYREAIEKGINATRYTNPEVAYILSKALEGEE